MPTSFFSPVLRTKAFMNITLSNIQKSFGETAVLTGVTLEVNSGEVLALVGENGAGKSTLTRVISGAYRPDAGQILFDGVPVNLKRPQDAMARGVRVIYQEFLQNIFPHLSVSENMFTLDEGGTFGRLFVSKKRMAKTATELMARIGLYADPHALAETLSIGELQMLEIAKSMAHDTKLLILDEPTAALDEQESERLFAQVEAMREAGIAIIYISHRLEEVFALSDRIIVLRNGTVALEGATSSLTEREVVTAMVGKELDDFYPKETHGTDEVVLEMSSLASGTHFQGVNLTVRAGEVLGIGGVMGCGKGSLLRSLFGLLPVTAGVVKVNGDVVSLGSPQTAMNAGIAYITPDRQAEGLLLQQSVAHNISLASLDEMSPTGVIKLRQEMTKTRSIMSALNVKAASPEVAVGTLSGGNQQKVLFGRWVMTNPRILLMEEPTRGVDIGAKTEIYRIINQQAAQGVAIILVSSDLPELVAMSDRVAVMRQGRVVAELTGDDLTQNRVLEHALESAA
ncbi:MAG: ABC-type sugar transport system ATPase subunit [Alpinimonas sp.]|jgi:ABC-type sugar transport system ATPase subunit